MKYWLSNENETRRAGAALAAVLLPLASSTPVVVFVRGNLGAGKSTFVRGFLSRVGVTGVMPSPTYSLVEPYQTETLNVFHMDAYRIADGAELDYLGLDEIEHPGSILLVEWPDHVRDELPTPTATVDLEMSPHPDRHSSAKLVDQCVAKQPTRTGTAQGVAQDGVVQDRHDSAKPLGVVQDRHDSAKPLGSDQAQDQAQDSHSFDLGRAERAEDRRAEDRHPTGLRKESGRERPNASEVGRLLQVTLGVVPVQIEQRLSSSEDWQGLFKVVT